MAKRDRNDDDRNKAIGKDAGPARQERSLGSLNVHTKGGGFSQTPPPEGIERELPRGKPTDDLHPEGEEHHPHERSGTNYGTPAGAPRSRSQKPSERSAEMRSHNKNRDDESWKVPEGRDRTRDPEFEMPDPDEAERSRREGQQIREQMEKSGKKKAA
jgi:hypothetical protein